VILGFISDFMELQLQLDQSFCSNNAYVIDVSPRLLQVVSNNDLVTPYGCEALYDVDPKKEIKDSSKGDCGTPKN
jgi:hypothetical protein